MMIKSCSGHEQFCRRLASKQTKGNPLGTFLVALLAILAASPILHTQEPPYGTASWDADTLGNHRAVIRVNANADAVSIHLPWRRRDLHPEDKEIFIYDAHGARMTNVFRAQVNREFGDLVFQPVSGTGEYEVYYLPFTGGIHDNYPKIGYPPPKATSDPEWLRRNHLQSPDPSLKSFPAAELITFQSVDDFNRFDPMELIATRQEIDRLLALHPGAQFMVFPEDRQFPIRMTGDLPERWMRHPLGQPFEDKALRGEFYVFQLGVWAARAGLTDLKVRFEDLRGKGAASLPASSFRCFNLGGVDWQNAPFTRRVDVPVNTVQPLWCGVQIPEGAAPGTYAGRLQVSAQGAHPAQVELRLAVSGEKIANAGDDEPSRLSRLRWLDSALAQDDGIVAPYTPVKVEGQSVGILGRSFALGPDGLPASIHSYFDIRMTALSATPRELLTGPIRLIAEDTAGQTLPWSTNGVKFTKQAAGAAAWESHSNDGPLAMNLHAQAEFDGTIEYDITLRAREAIKLNDIRLEIPLARPVARYAMGLGLKGGNAPPSFDWQWEVKHNQDGAWIGDVNAGLQFTLKDDRYSRPLNTNFYLSKPLVMPASWQNGGGGGCRFRERGADTYLIACFSGPRTMQRGEVQHYSFRLLLTPFHIINPAAQWSTRYYHAFKPLEDIAATGANTINVHHATAINPFINYPFLRPREMKRYIDDAHARNMKVKIYYTVRELTNHAPELFALRSLGNEVMADGPGGGGPWLEEHLHSGYISGWHVPELKDAAVVTTGISRWHNFYVEGLQWLAKNVGIDGLYLDDVAFDRTTMKRVRKVLLRNRPEAMIDLHSANQFNPRDGYANSANLYLEHFPFIDRLWFGEYFDYNAPPDFWLTEMSGIPFGLMGEMLQDGGNPWRGMVFGMTNRLPWAGDPRPLWKFWDENRIQQTEMLGYWVPQNPVKTGRDDVLATVYQGGHRAIVAVGSWAAGDVTLNLTIDWKALGIDPSRARITAPAIPNFQNETHFAPEETIPVTAGKGWLLVVDQQ
jgi:hypothetical protein